MKIGIVNTDRLNFFARIGDEYENPVTGTKAYHVWELDPRYSAERNHYIVAQNKVTILDE